MSRAETLPLLGGALCLAFANTLEWRRRAAPEDALASYGDLVRWMLRTGALAAEAGDLLQRRAEAAPAPTRAALDRAVAWREALYGLFSAVAATGEAPADLAERVAEGMAPLLAATSYPVRGRRGSRVWRGEPDDLDRALWPIAWSAHDLLTGTELPLVRECANLECCWLFVDRSRNRSRRWCEMASCGNLMKARRHRGRASS
ncbi:MAG TPA: ABATE domain-containing protein [Geminicoccaceae bacterium]|nr:ABATE domain-containing protein [Geminicoccaceae bacterium]